MASPFLVNVAVSRAVDRFIVVTNNDNLPRCRYLRDLIGYIEYQTPGEKPPVSTWSPCSICSTAATHSDWQSWLGGSAPTRPIGSEEIIRVVLGNILGEAELAHLRPSPPRVTGTLRNLVSDPARLTTPQQSYLRHRASVDFVVFNHITRRPLLVIEVDGFQFHENNPEQTRRDQLKDDILRSIGLPLLRLETTGSDEGRQIREALRTADSHWLSEATSGDGD